MKNVITVLTLVLTSMSFNAFAEDVKNNENEQVQTEVQGGKAVEHKKVDEQKTEEHDKTDEEAQNEENTNVDKKKKEEKKKK